MDSRPHIHGLTSEGCEIRKRRLEARLHTLGLEAALLCDRRHVYYFCGYWAAAFHAPVLVVRADGSSHAVIPDTSQGVQVGATTVSYYPSHRRGTLTPDQLSAALREMEGHVAGPGKWGADSPRVALATPRAIDDLSSEILALRRFKVEDEVALIRHAIRACEAAYARVAEILQPGLSEIDLYAEVQATAIKELGEPIGELGNDFQSGTPGGPPRARAIEAGELMPLDVAIAVRGYRCDLCRTFTVGGDPSAAQRAAGRRVTEVLEFVEGEARAGASCRRLYEIALNMLDGFGGWNFFHHLGHGTGLSPHEAPYLNFEWDDVLQVGDLFTMEPGLYHPDLRGGVRLEQNYWLSGNGLSRLSSYPLGW